MINETSRKRRKIAIAGCVGIPAKYGGFETLAENLALYAKENAKDFDIYVYCSGKSYPEKVDRFAGARLIYVPLRANGAASILYDVCSLIDAAVRGIDDVLLLGHGGSFALPLLKAISPIRVLTNIDGIEWQREKWSRLARFILRLSESFAIRHSDVVIADNEAIREYVARDFAKECAVIPYGGDHALNAQPNVSLTAELPRTYALALCRIEPENNVELILRAFSRLEYPLVFVGNWDGSEYGRGLKAKYQDHENIVIHDPVYEPAKLRAFRDAAGLYVHGHSAGGTNPSLVEMMHFGIPVLAHGCDFNRFTTEGKAYYFMSEDELIRGLSELTEDEKLKNGKDMTEIARRRYTWDRVGEAYFDLLGKSIVY